MKLIIYSSVFLFLLTLFFHSKLHQQVRLGDVNVQHALHWVAVVTQSQSSASTTSLEKEVLQEETTILQHDQQMKNYDVHQAIVDQQKAIHDEEESKMLEQQAIQLNTLRLELLRNITANLNDQEKNTTRLCQWMAPFCNVMNHDKNEQERLQFQKEYEQLRQVEAQEFIDDWVGQALHQESEKYQETAQELQDFIRIWNQRIQEQEIILQEDKKSLWLYDNLNTDEAKDEVIVQQSTSNMTQSDHIMEQFMDQAHLHFQKAHGWAGGTILVSSIFAFVLVFDMVPKVYQQLMRIFEWASSDSTSDLEFYRTISFYAQHGCIALTMMAWFVPRTSTKSLLDIDTGMVLEMATMSALIQTGLIYALPRIIQSREWLGRSSISYFIYIWLVFAMEYEIVWMSAVWRSYESLGILHLLGHGFFRFLAFISVLGHVYFFEQHYVADQWQQQQDKTTDDTSSVTAFREENISASSKTRLSHPSTLSSQTPDNSQYSEHGTDADMESVPLRSSYGSIQSNAQTRNGANGGGNSSSQRSTTTGSLFRSFPVISNDGSSFLGTFPGNDSVSSELQTSSLADTTHFSTLFLLFEFSIVCWTGAILSNAATVWSTRHVSLIEMLALVVGGGLLVLLWFAYRRTGNELQRAVPLTKLSQHLELATV